MATDESFEVKVFQIRKDNEISNMNAVCNLCPHRHIWTEEVWLPPCTKMLMFLTPGYFFFNVT